MIKLRKTNASFIHSSAIINQVQESICIHLNGMIAERTVNMIKNKDVKLLIRITMALIYHALKVSRKADHHLKQELLN
jgi:hypothetical protein